MPTSYGTIGVPLHGGPLNGQVAEFPVSVEGNILLLREPLVGDEGPPWIRYDGSSEGLHYTGIEEK